MQLYHPQKTELTLAGNTFYADDNGIITVPDNQINSSVWTQGFVSAKAKLEELATRATPEPIAVPAPAPVPSVDTTTKTK